MATKGDLDAWIRAEPITSRELIKFNFPQDTFESLNSEFARMKRSYARILESRKAHRSSVVALQMTAQACHLRRLETQAFQSARGAA